MMRAWTELSVLLGAHVQTLDLATKAFIAEVLADRAMVEPLVAVLVEVQFSH